MGTKNNKFGYQIQGTCDNCGNTDMKLEHHKKQYLCYACLNQINNHEISKKTYEEGEKSKEKFRRWTEV
jgi:ssDNA-binding Zn-finger/Zn-ribbon topoisomerase 1